MFARVKSFSSLTKGSTMDTGRRSGWLRLQKQRSASLSYSDVESYTSDASEPRTMRRIESQKHLHKTVSKTRRGWLRFANRAYERAWRRERRLQNEEPIIVNMDDSHLIDILCNCDRCPCEHDELKISRSRR